MRRVGLIRWRKWPGSAGSHLVMLRGALIGAAMLSCRLSQAPEYRLLPEWAHVEALDRTGRVLNGVIGATGSSVVSGVVGLRGDGLPGHPGLSRTLGGSAVEFYHWRSFDNFAPSRLGRRIQQVFTDSSGRFTSKELPLGYYLVAAVPPPESGLGGVYVRLLVHSGLRQELVVIPVSQPRSP